MRLPWREPDGRPGPAAGKPAARTTEARTKADRRGGGGGRRQEDWVRAEAPSVFGRLPVAVLAGAGFASGLVVGATVWDRLIAGSRRGLFSPHPMSRYHAVSYLAGHPSVDTARLLRDYARWEPHPMLRRRARRVLQAVEASL